MTKAQLSELETLLGQLHDYLAHLGAPKSLMSNVDDMGKSINWAREQKKRKAKP